MLKMSMQRSRLRLAVKRGDGQLGLVVRCPAAFINAAKWRDQRPALTRLAFLCRILFNIVDRCFNSFFGIKILLPSSGRPHSWRSTTSFGKLSQWMNAIFDQPRRCRSLKQIRHLLNLVRMPCKHEMCVLRKHRTSPDGVSALLCLTSKCLSDH